MINDEVGEGVTAKFVCGIVEFVGAPDFFSAGSAFGARVN
jgi:hypothetical protein